MTATSTALICQGALPPVALAVLFMLLPIVLRLFARLGGLPLTSLVERSLMTRYFLFTVIHGPFRTRMNRADVQASSS